MAARSPCSIPEDFWRMTTTLRWNASTPGGCVLSGLGSKRRKIPCDRGQFWQHQRSTPCDRSHDTGFDRSVPAQCARSLVATLSALVEHRVLVGWSVARGICNRMERTLCSRHVMMEGSLAERLSRREIMRRQTRCRVQNVEIRLAQGNFVRVGVFMMQVAKRMSVAVRCMSERVLTEMH